MLTLDYEYYRDTYKGALSEEVFQANLPKAIDTISLMISSEPETMSDNLKRAVCYGVDYEQTFDTESESNFTSEHLDDYSYTRSESATSRKASALMQKIIALLGREGLYSASVRLKVRRKCYHY